MITRTPRIITGQQLGVGWTPALSVVKALQALALARHWKGEALYWMAGEDHDHLEAASTVAFLGDRILRHRFHFDVPPGTATGWFPWTETHQREAERLWGPLPMPDRPTLQDHVRVLGHPLVQRGLAFVSPLDPTLRSSVEGTLRAWRALDLEADLEAQAHHLESQGEVLPLDPRRQAAWFALDPTTGHRRRLERGEPCPTDHWLSPGAALRPLFQSLLFAPTHVVLGPTERAYWRLVEPLWAKLGLTAPILIPRTLVHLLPHGLPLTPFQLDALRIGFWEAFVDPPHPLPSQSLPPLQPDPHWGLDVGTRYRQTLIQTRHRLLRLDRRVLRAYTAQRLGHDPERLRQRLFPFGKPAERVLPGCLWLRNARLLDALLAALVEAPPLLLLEEP